MNDTPNNLSPDSAFCQLFNQSADPSLLLTHTQIIASNTAANFLLKGFRKTIISQELSDLAPSNQPDGISSQISALTHVKAAYQYGSDRFTWSMQTCNEIILPVEILLTRITAGEDFFLHAVIREKISNTNHEQDVLAIERDLGIILGETNNLQDALMLILTASLHLEGVDCGGIYLIEEDSKNLKLQASINLSDDYISKTSIYSKDSPIMKQVLEGRPMYGIISSIMGELDEIRKKEGLLAVASIPIHSGGEIIGTLNIGSRTTPQLNNDAKIAIELLSSQIGGAIARIRGAELLAKTQYNLHHLFDSIDDLLFIIDFNGQLISTNQAVQQKLHYSSEELASMNVCELHSPEDITLVTSTFSQMIDGTKTTCTIPLLTKEGNSIPVETRVSRGWWSGRPVFFGISRDITEENIIRHKLIETLDFNEKIIESSSLGIVAFRADDGQCIMANESAVNIIGATKNQILEQNFRSIPSWKKSNIIKIAEESLQKWIRNRAELNFKTSFGKQIWIDVIFVPFSANNIPHLLLIFDEITGRKKSQEAIRKKEGILNSIARAARSFLTNTTREETILAMLQDMGTVMEVDRVYIFQNHFDEETGEHLTSQRYEWTCANIEKQRNNELLQNTPFSMIPDWEIQLKFGNHISGVVTSFQNPVRDFLHQQGIISILLVPIRIGEDFWGFIGFDDCHTERVWTRTETTVLKVAADIIGGAIGRKLTEEALIAKKQELLDIINHLPDATMVVDHNRKVIAWNRAMEELTGYGADEMLGKGDYQYAIPFYGEKRPILVDYILNPDEIINQESAGNIIIDSVLSGEFTVQRDDSCRHLSARATLIKDQKERVIGAIESIRDITWKVDAEHKLLQYNQELELKNQSLDELSTRLIALNRDLDNRVNKRTEEIARLLQIKNSLITQIGHDLKTPLTPVIALLPLIFEKTTDPEIIEILTTINRSSHRLKRVVNTVLEYSHIADGNGIFEKKGHAIRDIFNNAISDMKEIIKQKNLTVSNQIPKEIRIYIAEAHADTIAMNLISNAVKYTRNNDSIKIELTNRDNEVEICVSDTGIGMTPEECSRVFDEFYRADASRHDGESCGLGLAIVSKITSLYGAGITAYSEGVNKGSRFCILFEKNIIKDS